MSDEGILTIVILSSTIRGCRDYSLFLSDITNNLIQQYFLLQKFRIFKKYSKSYLIFTR